MENNQPKENQQSGSPQPRTASVPTNSDSPKHLTKLRWILIILGFLEIILPSIYLFFILPGLKNLYGSLNIAVPSTNYLFYIFWGFILLVALAQIISGIFHFNQRLGKTKTIALIIFGLLLPFLYFLFMMFSAIFVANTAVESIYKQGLTMITPYPTTPNPTANWKTYTNPQYAFQIKYPAIGEGLINGHFSQGECGQYIKLNSNPPTGFAAEIDFDSFFGIFIKTWNGSINDFVTRNDNSLPIGFKSSDLYFLTQIKDSNFDEAAVVVLKNQNGTTDNSPLAQIFAIYKKNNFLYLLSTFQGEGEGCTFPWKVIPYNEELESHEAWWNVPTSFKLLQ